MAEDAVPKDATDVLWNYFAAAGVACGRLRTLADRLEADFKAVDGGYAAFHSLPMPQRAIVSDQILGSASAIATNLLEAKLHEANLNSFLADGIPPPPDESTYEAHEQ